MKIGNADQGSDELDADVHIYPCSSIRRYNDARSEFTEHIWNIAHSKIISWSVPVAPSPETIPSCARETETAAFIESIVMEGGKGGSLTECL